MRISDWSSDLCSSDLTLRPPLLVQRLNAGLIEAEIARVARLQGHHYDRRTRPLAHLVDQIVSDQPLVRGRRPVPRQGEDRDRRQSGGTAHARERIATAANPAARQSFFMGENPAGYDTAQISYKRQALTN